MLLTFATTLAISSTVASRQASSLLWLLSFLRAGHCLGFNLGMTNGFEMINALTFITDLPYTHGSCLAHEICHTDDMSGRWAYVWLMREQITKAFYIKARCLLLREKLDGLCTLEHYAHEPLLFQ